MQHEPMLTADGSWSFLHAVHGEGFHAKEGAWTQALLRYARECRVRERGFELAQAGAGVFRLLDVGTGLGLNLAAALHELRGSGLVLEADSFELDAGVPRAACALPAERGEGAECVALVRAALSSALDGAVSGAAPRTIDAGPLRLRLHLGDARVAVAGLPRTPAFDAVFLDPFSPGVEGDLWEPAFCAELAARMAPQARLSTYAAGTAVRAALHQAGLRVGLGARVGAKREGTLASPAAELPPLSPKQARRLERPAG